MGRGKTAALRVTNWMAWLSLNLCLSYCLSGLVCLSLGLFFFPPSMLSFGLGHLSLSIFHFLSFLSFSLLPLSFSSLSLAFLFSFFSLFLFLLPSSLFLSSSLPLSLFPLFHFLCPFLGYRMSWSICLSDSLAVRDNLFVWVRLFVSVLVSVYLCTCWPLSCQPPVWNC